MGNRRWANIESDFQKRGFKLLVGDPFADQLDIEANPTIEFALNQSAVFDTITKASWIF